MDKNSLKTEILVLLEDEEVRTKVWAITLEKSEKHSNTLSPNKVEESNQNECHAMQAESDALKEENAKLRSMLGLKDSALAESESVIRSLNVEKSGLEEKLSVALTDFEKKEKTLAETLSLYEELKRKITFYRDNFEEDLRIKEVYEELSSQTKVSIKNIFKDTTPKGLVVCGTQEKFIFSFWDYIKAEINNGSNQDDKKLVCLFELLFARFKLAFPMFELQQVKEGDVFDNQNFVKHHSSQNMSGPIQALLFRGCVNNQTGKIVKQSIVVL
ncbi:hypothetical protein PSEHALCIP103_01619 [Pseudoalteromonas haloplanktis]|uniref:Uncharacterized protein n=1 Tax=Pseudoalteromonas haloplanktis TaxID=228 RepID=A0A9W4QX96_PSEHA|nr:hypothetical protein [Pseudoalteromonas haloplanktis]CAH9057253.1 hypothetical protein PSEHALCIP103_01619 [Pseudoalteromonas haloplanktis]